MNMVDKFVEKLSKETFKNILYIAFIACFWVVSFYLFKPSLLKESFILLVSLLFCLSLMYFILSFILLLLLEKLLLKSRFVTQLLLIRVEIYLIVSLIIKSISMCIGYYYSVSFTKYLRGVFIFWATAAALSCLIVVYQYIKQIKKQV